MKLRELKCAFFLILSLLTCLLMYLLLDTSVAVTASGWTHQRLYDFAALFDKEPIYIIIFLGVIALAETVAGLLYLLTPVEQRMIKYKQGEDEVLVNLDTLAASLQRTVEGEPDVDYINVHGTATPLGDIAEPKAIIGIFGEHAYKLSISSTKSMTGHLLGASGALEAVFSVRALQEGIIPPTINYETPDPECDLDYVPNQARKVDFDHVLSNSIGFGGHNATLIISRFKE